MITHTTPRVSVVIPTYGREQYLDETLGCVFAQTFQDFEVIVVNDGSPDRTADRLRPWVDNGKIRYIEQPNQGQAVARNTGIGLARGEFLALLDDDDLWPPDKLAWQVDLLAAQPAAVACYGYAKSFGTSESFRLPAAHGPEGLVSDEVLRGNFILSPGQVLVRTAAVRSLGGFDIAMRGSEDWDMWVRLGRTGPFIYREVCALYYRQHAVSTSQNPGKMFRAGLQVLHKHLGKLPLHPRWRLWFQTRGFIGRYTSTTALGQAYGLARQGQRWTSLKRLGAALRFHPLLLGTSRFWRVLRECASPQRPA